MSIEDERVWEPLTWFVLWQAHAFHFRLCLFTERRWLFFLHWLPCSLPSPRQRSDLSLSRMRWSTTSIRCKRPGRRAETSRALVLTLTTWKGFVEFHSMRMASLWSQRFCKVSVVVVVVVVVATKRVTTAYVPGMYLSICNINTPSGIPVGHLTNPPRGWGIWPIVHPTKREQSDNVKWF